MTDKSNQIRYFTSYSGINLPLKLVGEIPQADMHNRNTFFEGHYDEQERLNLLRKIVYGETELEHRYDYYDNGKLKQAVIVEDEDDVTTLEFEQ